MQEILIAGGSGLVGEALTVHFLSRGYRVSHLGRTKKGRQGVQEFTWAPEKGTIEDGALKDGIILINMAGTNVAGGRWTEQNKKSILESRTRSAELLVSHIKAQGIKPAKYIAASAIGYYGLHRHQQVYREADAPAGDFMAQVCQAWEKSSAKMEEAGVPTIILRIGVVFSRKGGAWEKITAPIRKFAGIPLGKGSQVVPWIHIDDLTGMVEKAAFDPAMTGVYNAVAPVFVTNSQLTEMVARYLHKPFIDLPVPGFILKLALGEQAEIVLYGVAVSADKIQGLGFTFKYPDLPSALQDLLS